MINNVDSLSVIHRDEVNELMMCLQQCDVTVINVGARLSDDDKAAMMQVSGQLPVCFVLVVVVVVVSSSSSK